MAVAIPAGLAWRRCRRLDRELACIKKRIFPAAGRERTIRPCDVCPVGTNRARQLAAHSRRQNAAVFAA